MGTTHQARVEILLPVWLSFRISQAAEEAGISKAEVIVACLLACLSEKKPH